MLAAYHHDNTSIEIFLRYRKKINLFEASVLGDLKELSGLLVHSSEQINQFAPDGFTAAGLASYFGQVNVLKLLIEKGANINLPANNQMSVYPIHSAVAAQNLEATKLLVSSGAMVNVTQANGITPLHSAAHNGNLDICRVLVEAGVDINALDNNGSTPLHMALAEGNESVANYLQRNGAI